MSPEDSASFIDATPQIPPKVKAEVSKYLETDNTKVDLDFKPKLYIHFFSFPYSFFIHSSTLQFFLMALEYLKVWLELLKVSILRFIKLFLFKVRESVNYNHAS